MPHHGGATQGSTRVSQEAEGAEVNKGKSFCCGFHEIEWTSQGKQAVSK